MYIISTSIPPDDNTMGLGPTTLMLFQRGAGPMLYFVSAMVIPPLARWAVSTIGQVDDSAMAAKLMITARAIVVLLCPFMMITVLNQQCFGAWLWFWSPCHQDGAFNLTFPAPMTIKTIFGVFHVEHIFQVTSRDEICEPHARYSTCPPAVIDALGTLLFDKMVFAAIVGPVRLLLLNTVVWRRAQEWIVHNLFGVASYRVTTDLDTEAAGIVMLLDA